MVERDGSRTAMGMVCTELIDPVVVGGGAIGKLGRESVGIGHRGLNSRLAG